jgi:hypothetical protein
MRIYALGYEADELPLTHYPCLESYFGMTPERLGRTLRAFNVKSEQLQEEGKRHRGYFRQALQDLNRYLSPPPSLPPPETRAPVHSSARQKRTVGTLAPGC